MSTSKSFFEQHRRSGADVLIRAALCHLLAETRGSFASDEAKNNWPNDNDVALLLRAAVSPATLGTSAWMGSLAPSANSDLISVLGPASAGSQILNRGPKLKFENTAAIFVPGAVANASNVSFVGEAAPIPVHAGAISGPLLQPRKFGSIFAFTNEVLAHSLPNLETIARLIITESVALALDLAMLSNAAGDSVRPPGLLNGISALTASSSTNLGEAMIADVQTLAAAVSSVAGNGPIIFVASPKQAVRFRIKRENVSYEVLSSGALADGVLIAIAANAVASAIDPVPRFKMADQATLNMSDTPVALSVTGTPNVVSAPDRSLFQTDTKALLMTLQLNWALRSSSGVAWLTGANW